MSIDIRDFFNLCRSSEDRTALRGHLAEIQQEFYALHTVEGAGTVEAPNPEWWEAITCKEVELSLAAEAYAVALGQMRSRESTDSPSFEEALDHHTGGWWQDVGRLKWHAEIERAALAKAEANEWARARGEQIGQEILQEEATAEVEEEENRPEEEEEEEEEVERETEPEMELDV